jgi:leader peptidase (prepilin peptidase) / N-methyltransferase
MLMLVFGFILGVCIGSFLNVCIDRVPAKQSLVDPPSHCPNCGKQLKWFDLFPILSYLQLRGRCRYCGASIPCRTLLIEGGMGIVFALSGLYYGFGIIFLFVDFYIALFLLLDIIDLEHGLILNRIVYPAICISLVMAPFWSNTPLERSFFGHDDMMGNFLSSVVGGALFFLVFCVVALAFKGGIGGGDVKMAGLIGLAVGLSNVPVALLVSVIGGGLLAGILLLLKVKQRKESIPFGPFLSLGAVVAIFWGSNLVDWYLKLLGAE